VYESFYNFQKAPFKLTPDPHFFYKSQTHSEGLAILHYALEQGEGFVVITGGPGTGKTELTLNLIDDAPRSHITFAQIVSTHLEADDILHLIAANFHIASTGISKGLLLKKLEEFFVTRAQAGHECVLLIDEAHNLSTNSLIEISMLANFQVNNRPVLQCFLLGHESLEEKLDQDKLLHLKQRIIASFRLEPISKAETRRYIEHRLIKAGWRGNIHFSDATHNFIYLYSGGIPRQINSICNRLLLKGFSEEKYIFNKQFIIELIAELEHEKVFSHADYRKEELDDILAQYDNEPVVTNLYTDVQKSQQRRSPNLKVDDFVVSASLGGSVNEVLTDETQIVETSHYKLRKILLTAFVATPIIAVAVFLYLGNAADDVSLDEKPLAVVEKPQKARIPIFASNQYFQNKPQSIKIEDISADEEKSTEIEQESDSDNDELETVVQQSDKSLSVVADKPSKVIPAVQNKTLPASENLNVTSPKTITNVENQTTLAKEIAPQSLAITTQQNQKPSKSSEKAAIPTELKNISPVPSPVASNVSPTLKLPNVSNKQDEITPKKTAVLVANQKTNSVQVDDRQESASDPENPIKGLVKAPIISEQEINTLLSNFMAAYEVGNLENFIENFALDARSNESRNRKEIERDYKKLFMVTDYRKLELDNLSWRETNNQMDGKGSFTITVREKGADRFKNISGNINLIIGKNNNIPIISELSYQYVSD